MCRGRTFGRSALALLSTCCKAEGCRERLARKSPKGDKNALLTLFPYQLVRMSCFLPWSAQPFAAFQQLDWRVEKQGKSDIPSPVQKEKVNKVVAEKMKRSIFWPLLRVIPATRRSQDMQFQRLGNALSVGGCERAGCAN